ncbi:MAG: ComEC/Rec2 family competence protein [Candidatus Zixiibacteriota bacterium]
MRAPALYALIFFVLGIVFGSYTDIPAMAFLGVAVLSTAAALIYTLVNRFIFSRIMLCSALFAAAGFLTSLQLHDIPANHISHFTQLGGRSAITATVDSEPDIRPTKTFLTVAAESLSRQGISVPVSGRIRIRIARVNNEFNVGDKVRFTGYVVAPSQSRNPGAFDYRRYLEIRQISATCNLGSFDRIERLDSLPGSGFIRDVVVPVREYITRVFDKYLPPEMSATMRGFLIGDVRFISRDVYRRFKDTGALHVLAASGSNVGYVTLTIFLVTKLFRLPRRSRYVLAISGVVIFSFLAYNQPSVVRASIMAVVALVGMSLRRDQNWLNTISVAGLIVLALHPLYLYDLGTQLSFGAAFALILFMPALDSFVPMGKRLDQRLARYFLLILFGSFVAQLGVMPILLYHFHTVPLVSFLSNLLIVPLVGFSATVGIVLVFASALPLLPDLCAALLELVLNCVLWSITFFDNLKIPPLQIGAPEFLTVLTYYLFLHVVLTIKTRSRHFLTFLMLFTIALNGTVWKAVFAGPEKGTNITILDTSKLTTLFVKQPDGSSILINGGGKNLSFDYGESVVLPFLLYRGINSVGQFCYTTERDDNIGALATVAETLEPGNSADSLSSIQRFRRLDPIVRLQSDSVRIVLLTELVSVQNLDSAKAPADILGLDWSYLDAEAADEALDLFQPETVIVTNYSSRYARLDRLTGLRKKYPLIKIISVIESGAVEIQVNRDRYALRTAIKN